MLVNTRSTVVDKIIVVTSKIIVIISLFKFKYKLINLGITVIQILNNEMGEKNIGNTLQITLGKVPNFIYEHI